MRPSSFLLCCCALLFAANIVAQPYELWQLREGRIAQWRYVDGDEFETPLDTEEQWAQAYSWGRNLGNKMLQYYSDDNSYTRDGLLILEAREQDTTAKSISWRSDDYVMPDGTPNIQDFKYTSGLIFSKKKYFGGLFESSIKLPAGQGYFPGFWLYGANPNEEVDIMEAKGERRDQYHIDMHCPEGCGGYKRFLFFKTGSFGGWVDTEYDLTEDFHLYTGEWTTGEVVFSFNDVEQMHWAGQLFHPARLILNLGVRGGGAPDGGFSGGITEETPFPQTLEAEYIRVYDRVDEGWEAYESSLLRRKGIKKRRRGRKLDERVRSTVRIFFEPGQLRVEQGGGGAPSRFYILAEDGTTYEMPMDEQGWTLSLQGIPSGTYELIGQMAEHEASISFEL